MIYEKIPVCPDGTETAVLTCMRKENTKGKPEAVRKAVILCPGGGYESCSSRESEPVAYQFLAMDCHVFVLDYSVAPAVFPAALRQLAAAVALLREKAGAWGIEPKGIYLCGFSAGGHLAASLGTFWPQEFVWKGLAPQGDMVRPDGLILSYPVISSGEFGHAGSFEHLTGKKREQQERDSAAVPFSGSDKENCSLWDFLSLEKQAGAQVPPVFLWHTYTDGTVPVENALLYAMALRRAGVSLELHIFPEGRHGLALANEETMKVEDDGRGTYVVPACQGWIRLAGRWLSER